MMKIRNIGLIITIIFSAIACGRLPENESDGQNMVGIWEFYTTKSGAVVDKVETYRASLLHNDDARLMSDGTYCGYHKPQGWLYPCSADDATGIALDTEGNAVAWDDESWFDKIDKDSRHALRAAAQYGHTLVVSSPAVRMQKFLVDGTEDTRHWGFAMKRENELFIGEPVINLNVTATWINGHYIFPISGTEGNNTYDGTLYDRRAKVTVKVACGALSQADLNSVYFRNVMSSAYYLPKSRTYENHVMDGGYANPLEEYYTVNTYNSLGESGVKIVGDKLEVPSTEPDIHLVQREDQSVAFTDADEWDKASNTGKIVTAIPEFTLFSLDYATLDGDQYKHKGLIPEIIVLSGNKGNIRSTVSLPANLEPMKSYTVIIYLSTASVQAELYVTDWDKNTDVDITFGETVKLPATSVFVDNWSENPDHPIEDGTITNR